MSMLSCLGGQAVAEEMLKFCSELESKIGRPLTQEQKDLLELIENELKSIDDACKSGWY